MVNFKKGSRLSKLSCSLKTDNPRKFWSYYKAITKTTRTPGVIKHESVQATRPIEQANLFIVFFHSVFAPPDLNSAQAYHPLFVWCGVVCCATVMAILVNNISFTKIEI